MRVLSVFEVTAYLKDLIELDPILSDVWVRGEVTNLSRSAAGHVYYCLVGDGMQVNCVLFRGNQVGLLAMPRNGDAVIAHGRVNIYDARGQYQLIVDQVAPEGIGLLQLQFEETKRRLEADGLFAQDRKRALPDFPAVVGVVTSAQGAVWHDIQNVVARRFPLTGLILAPSAVQGPSAPTELVAGLDALQESGRCDVIIIGRGGGAAEDLAAFNDEFLARSIFAARVPIVSAVGHETDTCIADLVADVRAPTPSAAAELCVPDGRAFVLAAGQLLSQARSGARRVLTDSRDGLREERTLLNRLHPRKQIVRHRQNVDFTLDDAHIRANRSIASLREHIASSQTRAELLDPRAVLRRGYAIVTATTNGEERRVVSANVALATDQVRLTFTDGSVLANVVQPANNSGKGSQT